MNPKDKKIIVFFIILTITYSSIIIYLDFVIPKPPPIEKVEHFDKQWSVTRLVKADKQSLFDSMINIEKFPLMLPQYVSSIKIFNKTQSVVECKSCHVLINRPTVTDLTNRTVEYVEITTSPIKTTFIARHIIDHEQYSHTLQILTGDIKDTSIEQSFDGTNSSLEILTAFDLHTQGFLKALGASQTQAYQKFTIPIIDQMISYSLGFNSETKKIVDDTYREILHRPADPQGLEHFSSLIDAKKITVDDLKKTLLESDERKLLLEPSERKSTFELSNETKRIVNSLYREILYRDADLIGMEHFGSLLEAGKITTVDLKKILLESDERKGLLLPNEKKSVNELSDETKQKLNALYQEMFLHEADPKGLEYWGSLLEAKKITYDELRQIFRNSPEYVPRYNETR
ncbi:MAG: DUF4214 domain-containing protein [Nitrosopumilaceae archaeon]